MPSPEQQFYPENIDTSAEKPAESADFNPDTARFHVIGDQVQCWDKDGKFMMLSVDEARQQFGRLESFRQALAETRYLHHRQELESINGQFADSPVVRDGLKEVTRLSYDMKTADIDYANYFYDQFDQFKRQESVDFLDLAHALQQTSDPEQQKQLLDTMPPSLRDLWDRDHTMWERLSQAKDQEEALQILVDTHPDDQSYQLDLDILRAAKYSSSHEEGLQKLKQQHPELNL